MKTKRLSLSAVALVMIALGISLAVPRFKDKNRTTGGTVPTVSAAVTEPATAADSTAASTQQKAKEESSTVSAAATAAASDTTAPRTQVLSTTEKIESGTVAGQAEWQGAQYYVERLGRVLTLPESATVLRYKYNEAEDFYYTNFTVPAGTLFYTYKNTVAPLTARYSDSLDVRFDYGGKAWLVHLVKGQYAWMFVGGEAEVFCTKKGSVENLGDSNALYSIPAAEECPDISVTVQWKPEAGEPISFSRSEKQAWLCDGYAFGVLDNAASPLKELSMTTQIEFPDAGMATAFAAGLDELGFRSVRASSDLPADSYCLKENAVSLNWQCESGSVTVANEQESSFS